MINNQSKKIAFVATVYRHIEAFHLPFIKLLQVKGYEIHVYGSSDHGKEGVLKSGVVCHDISFKRNPFNIENLKALNELTNSFKNENFIMVHFHTPVASIIGRIASKKAKIPNVIYTAHGFHFFNGAPLINWLLYYPIEKMMARWTDLLITINKEDFSRAKNFGVRKKVIFIHGVGVETRRFIINNKNEVKKQKRNELGLKDSDFIILCVAELNQNKNQKQLIDAIHILNKRFNNIKCLLVGIGEDHQSLFNMVNELQLNEVIHFLGFRRDIPELIAAADVVSLLSKREGLPLALLEAIAGSKPIIATEVRGSRDIVVDGENGFLVPVSNVDMTVKAFSKLIEDPIKIQQMGKKSREVANGYDLTKIVSQMDSVYKSVLSLDEIKSEKRTREMMNDL